MKCEDIPCPFPKQPPKPDPVRVQKKEEKGKKHKRFETIPDSKIRTELTPSFTTRGAIAPIEKLYERPQDSSKTKKKTVHIRPQTFDESRHFEYDLYTKSLPQEKKSRVFRIPSPVKSRPTIEVLRVDSPDTSKGRVQPTKPSITSLPWPTEVKNLDLKKPTSGIVFRLDDDTGTLLDKMSFGYDRPYSVDLIKKYNLFNAIDHGEDYDSARIEELLQTADQKAEGDQISMHSKPPEAPLSVTESKASKGSKQPSEFKPDEEPTEKPDEGLGAPTIMSEDSEPPELISKWVQRFRRESDAQKYETPKVTIVRGTLESHSFTNIKLKPVKEYKYGILQGSYDQGDYHFPERSRNKQYFANGIVAYCFSFIKHPVEWNSQNVDDILEMGDRLYNETLEFLHYHGDSDEVKPLDLITKIIVTDRKFFFRISDPLVVGYTKSDNKKIFNLKKGLSLFFNRYSCALFQTHGFSLVIWKNRFFYLFDPTPRAKDLYPDDRGAACLISFYDIDTIVSLLVERTKMGNWPFSISRIDVIKNVDAKSEDEPDSMTSGFQEANEYKVLSDNKAVVSASFNLNDPCFDFTCNKQALTMTIIGAVYTKITPSAAWCRTILDKILILGNQLFLEIIEKNDLDMVELQDLPGIFVLGPYQVTIVILANVIKGTLLSRKKYPNLESGITQFFEHSSMGILQYDRFTYGIWQERGFYYLFDPYSRDYEGFQSRDGTACFSMHNCVESLIETLSMNIEKELNCPFTINAIKYLKIEIGGDEIRETCIEEVVLKQGGKKQITQKWKTICIDVDTGALEKFAPNTVPSQSLISVATEVVSLDEEYIPKMHHGHPMPSTHPMPKSVSKVSLGICDLDSPSLSDTQIVPPRPHPRRPSQMSEYSELSDEFEIKVEELLSEEGEGEDHEDVVTIDLELHAIELAAYEKQMLEEINEFADMGEEGVEKPVFERTKSAQTMTDGFFMLAKRILKPPRPPKPSAYVEPPLLKPAPKTVEAEVTMSEELKKETNFVPMPDGTEVMLASSNIANAGKDFDSYAPFVAIMAVVMTRKFKLVSWNSDVLSYIIDTGTALGKISKVRFEESPIHEFERIGLGSTDFSCKVTYVMESSFRASLMERTLSCLFNRCTSAIIVNPHYSCTIFYINHLYYLYDPYGNNAAGLSNGTENVGMACLVRFTNIHQLVARMVFNKSKRESNREYRTTSFIISFVEVHMLYPEESKPNVKPKKQVKVEGADGDTTKEDIDQYPQPKSIGFDENNHILGSNGLKAKNKQVEGCIKECHFVSAVAVLMLMLVPIKKWDSERIDRAIETGQHIFSHASSKEIFERRIINNILIENYFFDIVIRKLEFPITITDLRLGKMLEYFSRKNQYLLLQFPTCCTVFYSDSKYQYLFDPYTVYDENAQQEVKANWTRFDNQKKMIRYIKKSFRGFEYCNYYAIDVTSIRKAKKTAALGHYLSKYKLEQRKFKEYLGKPFYEREEWMDIDPIPWARTQLTNATGMYRGDPGVTWKEWDVERPNDLWSLWSNLHQKSNIFPVRVRGKQTICNCIVALFMTQVYDFSEWNAILMDNILTNGNRYFEYCSEELPKPRDKDDEVPFEIDNLKPEVQAPPFTCQISYEPIVEGTMYVVLPMQFNLFKAVAYFFNNQQNRLGLVIATNGKKRRIVAFGKLKDFTYFMYDCQTYGAPLFLPKQGCSYILKMNSLNRLVHCLALTLREGDFYIYEIILHDIVDTTKQD